jgi:hypothetical protein
VVRPVVAAHSLAHPQPAAATRSGLLSTHAWIAIGSTVARAGDADIQHLVYAQPVAAPKPDIRTWALTLAS